MSRGAWRRAVLVWVVAVVVGGALTVWLRDSAQPPETHGRYGTGGGDPTPELRPDVEDACAATPGDSPGPTPEAGPTAVVCAYAIVR
ncbi:hypothetical protein ACW4TU_13815 [Streptomyces sp. QTS52]